MNAPLPVVPATAHATLSDPPRSIEAAPDATSIAGAERTPNPTTPSLRS